MVGRPWHKRHHRTPKQRASAVRAEEARFLAELGLTPPQIGRVLDMRLNGVRSLLGRDANRGRARRDGAT